MWNNCAAHPTGKLWISVHRGGIHLCRIFRSVYEALESDMSFYLADFYHFLLSLDFLFIIYFNIYCAGGPSLPFYFFYCCFLRHEFDAAGRMNMCKNELLIMHKSLFLWLFHMWLFKHLFSFYYPYME